MFGAVAAGKENGGFERVEEAQEKMAHLKEKVYSPRKENIKVYRKLYSLYKELHDIFGTKEYSSNLSHLMKELLKIKEDIKC